MHDVYMLAVAPEQKVNQAIEELTAGKARDCDYTLISTKAYRHPAIQNYIDLDADSLNENVSLSLPINRPVIVIQNSETVVSYVNVYRCLKANNVEKFTIKVAGKGQVETCADSIFGFINHESSDDEGEVVWISPSLLNQRKEFEKVSDLDWNTESLDFNDSISFYQGAVERFNEGKQWQDTAYYKDVISSIRQGVSRFGCETEEALRQRCEYLDALYLDIKQNGWKQLPDSDYVTINIGAQGEIFFNDGRHRTVIAKLLNLDSIPVKVSARHPAWQAFKQEIKLYADTHNNGRVYNALSHPDLASIPHTQDDHRGEVILQSLDMTSGTVLDIGCHWGYFCGRFEDIGFEATGVEADVSNYYFLEKLKRANNHHFISCNQSIFDVITTPTSYNVVLALNIFHHFIKSEEQHEQLVTLLQNLNADVLYLQTHNPEEPQMKGAFKNYDSNEFSGFVMQHGQFTESVVLQEYDNGRVLFKLSKRG